MIRRTAKGTTIALMLASLVFVSGHTLKHHAATVATFIMLRMLLARRSLLDVP